MMQNFGRERKVLVDVHEVIRYEDKSENIKTVEYTGCVGFEVVADAKYWPGYKFVKENEGVLRYLMATK